MDEQTPQETPEADPVTSLAAKWPRNRTGRALLAEVVSSFLLGAVIWAVIILGLTVTGRTDLLASPRWLFGLYLIGLTFSAAWKIGGYPGRRR
ncbi:hypothetical protein [Streptomyces sp. G1]|uniref:hypothetical protein n=1 Tax=Streptomyces sp. G1 TaxID=361572 RepID=UPI0020308DF3|nr:hypothetical protein [Streptomyces sp. G1]MCM1964884.1 hypothetical protein [Streptomyces sp. G1]